MMPSEMEEAQTIMMMVMKAGRPSERSSKLMLRMGDIIIRPTMISAGEVAAAGTEPKSGCRKK